MAITKNKVTRLQEKLNGFGISFSEKAVNLLGIIDAAQQSRVTDERPRGLDGIKSSSDVRKQIELRADIIATANYRTAEAVNIVNVAETKLSSVLAASAEDFIEQLRPAVEKAWATISDAAKKLGGEVTAEHAVTVNGGAKAYTSARDAHQQIRDALSIRNMLVSSGAGPDVRDSTLERASRLWKFDTQDAVDAYLLDTGDTDPLTVMVSTANIKGITFRWSTYDQQEQQESDLIKESRGKDLIQVWDSRHGVLRMMSRREAEAFHAVNRP